MLLTAADVAAAEAVLDGVVRRTPVEPSRALGAVAGGEVLLKCEHLQRTGSFKIRGAYVRISRLTAAERARGVVAASAGNHAQGVALASALLGTSATVFMPETVPLPKLAATRGYGADVRLVGTTVADALVAAGAHAAESGAVIVHPYDHHDIVAGQGTVGAEIARQCPDARTVLVCTGGGGLLAGVAVAVRAALPRAAVVGVQAEGAAAWPPSLAAGHPVTLERLRTMADGIAVSRPGDVPFEHVVALVDDIVTVSDEHISQALLMLLERSKLVAEPAGAAAAAALFAYPGRWEPPVVVVVSGGNIDPLLLSRVLQHGLAAAGRYLTVTVRVRDLPGRLSAMLHLVARLGVNVVDIDHERTGPRLQVNEAEVRLTVETRGPDHTTELLAALAAGGYQVAAQD